MILSFWDFLFFGGEQLKFPGKFAVARFSSNVFGSMCQNQIKELAWFLERGCIGNVFFSRFLKITLPETNSSPLKMDGLNTTFLLGRPIFRGYVSFREGKTVGL